MLHSAAYYGVLFADIVLYTLLEWAWYVRGLEDRKIEQHNLHLKAASFGGHVALQASVDSKGQPALQRSLGELGRSLDEMGLRLPAQREWTAEEKQAIEDRLYPRKEQRN